MSRSLLAVLVLASLAVGYLIGAVTYPSGRGAEEQAEVEALRDEVERWRMALGARSYINVETRSRSMLVQAFHTFPDDYAIVKSQSLFEAPK